MKNIIIILLLSAGLFSCKAQQETLKLEHNKSVVFLDSITAVKEINEDNLNGFFRDIGVIDMSIQMKKNCADRSTCLTEYKEYLSQDVASFTKEEMDKLKETYSIAYKEINKVNSNIIPNEIQLIKTKGKHYGNSVYYTRENIIVIPQNEITNFNPSSMLRVTYHELFHVISRYEPELKDDLYNLIGFSKLDSPLETPDALRKRILLNPDGIDMDYVIELEDTTTNRSFSAIPIILSSEDQFVEEKQAFFAYLKFDFYEVMKEDNGKYSIKCDENGYSTFKLKNASNFHSQIKDNTGYIIHPDEIMADNFMMAIGLNKNEDREKLSAEGKDLLLAVEKTLKNHK